MVVLLPLLLALLAPFVLVAQHLVLDPAARAVVVERPQALVQIVLGLGFCGVLFGWPLVHFARRLGQARSIAVDERAVAVTERKFGRARSWSEPLSGYAGLSHNIRSSLAGVSHELVLVHPDPARSVLVATRARLSETDVAFAAQVLNVAEIPSRHAARLPFRRGLPAHVAAQTLPGLARAASA